MGLIKVRNHVNQCFNGDDGQVIFDVVAPLLRQGTAVSLSFSGIDSVTSSFVNTALISLLDELSFSDIKKLLRFVDTTSEINELIRSRFVFEASRTSLKKNSSQMHMSCL